MKSIKTLLLITFAILLTNCSHIQGRSPQSEDIPFLGNLKVQRFQLENGLKLLVIENHSSPTFAIQTWFNVGSRNEVPTQTGLAHLFEHMMFKGTKNHPEGEFDRIMEEAGSQGTNAFTGNDYTAYLEELPIEEIDMVLELESDRMQNLIVDEKSFSTEREVVQNERRMRLENSPTGMMYKTLMETAYTTHPYRWPVIGYDEDLKKMSAEDAYAFYKKYYSPDRATIVIVGDIEGEKAFKKIKKYYSHLQPARTQNAPIPAEPPQTAPRRETLELNIEVDKFILAYHIPEALHEDTPALQLLEGYFNMGQSNILKKSLVDTGIATSASCSAEVALDPTLFYCFVSMQKNKNHSLGVKALVQLFNRLKTHLISDKELERTKNLIDFAIYSGFGENMRLARTLGQMENQFTQFEKGVANYQTMMRLGSSEMQQVLKKYFNTNNQVIIIGVPKK